MDRDKRSSARDKAATTPGKNERWLLTRKTWRYMTDAVGNFLIPENIRGDSTSITATSAVSNPEPRDDQNPDLVLGEALFRAACNEQQEFLLWQGSLPPHVRSYSLTLPSLDTSNVRGSSAATTSFLPPEDEDFLLDPDDYNEYDDEQATLREERKSSLASSNSSALSYVRVQSHQSAPVTSGLDRRKVSVAIQTEPLSEEALDRLRRLQSLTLGHGDSGYEHFPDVGAESSLDGVAGAKETSTPTSVGSSNDLDGRDTMSGGPACGSKRSSSGYSSSATWAVTDETTSTAAGDRRVCGGDGMEKGKKEEVSAYSASISDTVMRYLRMVRKNSKVDKSDIDRFKTVNYDRSLRNIKSKNVTLEEALEHEKKKKEQQQESPVAETRSPPQTPTSQVSYQLESSGRKAEEKKLKSRTFPSVGIQAGESLVRFLKLFNYRQKFTLPADECSTPDVTHSTTSYLPTSSPALTDESPDRFLFAHASGDTFSRDADEIDEIFSLPYISSSSISSTHPATTFPSHQSASIMSTQYSHRPGQNFHLFHPTVQSRNPGPSTPLPFSQPNVGRGGISLEAAGRRNNEGSWAVGATGGALGTNRVGMYESGPESWFPSTSITSGVRDNEGVESERRDRVRCEKKGAEKMVKSMPWEFLVMQKSKSSSSVLHQSSSPASSSNQLSSNVTPKLITKGKLFRSKKPGGTTDCSSPGKQYSSWTPQGKSGIWTSLQSGRQVNLESANICHLSEVESNALRNLALAKLEAFNLGVQIKIPRPDSTGTSSGVSKPKRRAYLLKKKAHSTGFFDSKREESHKDTGSGMVFNISLGQVVRNDSERRKGSAERKEGRSRSPPWEPTCPTLPSPSSRLSVTSDMQKLVSTPSSENLFWPEGNSNSTTHVLQEMCASNDPRPVSTEDSLGQIPEVIVACVKHLEAYGLNTTGIFRVSSSLKRIRQLREEIDSGKEIKFGEEHSPHDVAALLKEFLRDLPEPLLCKELYEAFLQAPKLRNRKIQLEYMQYLIDLLPRVNRDTLYALLRLFSKVVDNCQDKRSTTGELISGNKMEAYSLATLIAPNILPCIPIEGAAASAEQCAMLTKQRRDSIDVVSYMITNFKDLFTVSSEMLNQVYLELLEKNPEAVENILRMKYPAAYPDGHDLDIASEEFESGVDVSLDSPRLSSRKREEILHEGGGRGGYAFFNISSLDYRNKHDAGSKEKIDGGADSDSSSTKSTTRWFRKTRSGDPKSRASSDSGSEKGKSRKKKRAQGGGFEECKRASSLDSVNLMRDICRVKQAEAPTTCPSSKDRQRSSSDQALKIPLDLSRRQSSPLLDSSLCSAKGSSMEPSREKFTMSNNGNDGVIRASLKIQMPLHIDDSDIPYIEEDSSHEHPYSNARLNDPSLSPADDLNAFPCKEIEARIFVGVRANKEMTGGSGRLASKQSGLTACSKPTSVSEVSKGITNPQEFSPVTQTEGSSQSSSSSDAVTKVRKSSKDIKGHGKETKGANISGITKSKTADFEKLVRKASGTSDNRPMGLRGTKGEVPGRAKVVHLKTNDTSCTVDVRDFRKGVKAPTVINLCKSSTVDQVSKSPSMSGSTWKRSEIIASQTSSKPETYL